MPPVLFWVCLYAPPVKQSKRSSCERSERPKCAGPQVQEGRHAHQEVDRHDREHTGHLSLVGHARVGGFYTTYLGPPLTNVNKDIKSHMDHPRTLCEDDSLLCLCYIGLRLFLPLSLTLTSPSFHDPQPW